MFEKLPKFLSPSSLSKARKEPITFYLRKLRKDNIYPQEKTNLAAACGTAFDIDVKRWLIEKGVKTGKPLEYIEDSLSKAELILPEEYDNVRKAGRKLLGEYRSSRALFEKNWVSVEDHYEGKIGDAPVRGQLDATVVDPYTEQIIPFDFKVSGYTSKNGMSPKKGFYKKFDLEWKPAHKLYKHNMPIDEIDLGFARQFATYGHLMGLKPPFPVMFDHLCFNGKKKKIIVCSYRAVVTPKFFNELSIQYNQLWKELVTGTFDIGLPESILNGTHPAIQFSGPKYLLRLLAEKESWF